MCIIRFPNTVWSVAVTKDGDIAVGCRYASVCARTCVCVSVCASASLLCTLSLNAAPAGRTQKGKGRTRWAGLHDVEIAGGAAKARDEDEAMAATGKHCVAVNIYDGSVCSAVADCTAFHRVCGGCPHRNGL